MPVPEWSRRTPSFGADTSRALLCSRLIFVIGFHIMVRRGRGTKPYWTIKRPSEQIRDHGILLVEFVGA